MKYPSLYTEFPAFPPQEEFHTAYTNLRREALGQLFLPSTINDFITAGLKDHHKRRHGNLE
jgi:hypothetical protein